MNVRLTLRRDTRASGKPRAWFISGADPREWLEELGTWGVPMSEIVLHPVPLSANNRTPCGVLAVAPGDESIHPSPRALPYKTVVQGFYIPCDARLDPPVNPEGLEELRRYQGYVFHPVAGLVGLDEGDGWEVKDFVKPPEVRDSGWVMPHPGLPGSARLKSVFRIMPEDPSEIIDEGKSDIGQSDLRELPPLDGEPSPALPAKSLRQLRLMMADLGMKFVNIFPRNSPTRTWVNDLEDWLNQHRNEALGGIDQVRNRELHRLMELLNRDPDEGLKFAIPLDQTGGRGTANDPDGILGARDINFDFNKLGGGQASSTWVVSPDFMQQMRRVYLQAANQELAAGRFRRAAYVYAHLLNDFQSAAKALQKGGHHHEAAELYMKKLLDVRSGAKCLYDGGYLTEAVVHFTDLGDHETAGDIHRQLGDEEIARVSFRRAVADLVRHENSLDAAGMLEEKLKEPDEALDLLHEAWPRHVQAERCLAASFEIRGRLGRHGESLDLVRHLVADTDDPGTAATLVRVLAILNERYPDPDLRTMATDGARVVAGKNLPTAPINQLENLTKGLRGIHPDDSLFTRDTQRYFDMARIGRTAEEEMAPGRNRPCQQVEDFAIMPGVDWMGGTGGPQGVLACGFKPGQMTILHGGWTGRLGQEEIALNPEFGSMTLDHGGSANIKVTGPRSNSVAIQVRVSGINVEFYTQPVATSWGDVDRLDFSRSFWLPHDAACMAHGVAGRVFVIRFTGGDYLLEEYTPKGDLLEQVEIPLGRSTEPLDPETPLPCQVADTGHHTVVTVGRWLAFKAGREMTPHALKSVARRLTPFYHGNESMVAVSHPQGVSLVKIEPWTVTNLASDLANPLTLFLPSRVLIVVGSEGRIYETRRGAPFLIDNFKVGPGRPCSLVRGPVGTQFAILYDDGVMRMYSTVDDH